MRCFVDHTYQPHPHELVSLLRMFNVSLATPKSIVSLTLYLAEQTFNFSLLWLAIAKQSFNFSLLWMNNIVWSTNFWVITDTMVEPTLQCIIVTCSEKRDLPQFLMNIEILAWIDSSVYTEYNGASSKEKYWSQAELWPFLYTRVDRVVFWK